MTKLPAGIAKLKLSVNFIREANQVVVYSPALDLSTVGKNETEARKRFEEIVRIFFEDIAERKVASEVLRELGWSKEQNWQEPQISYKSISVEAPAVR